MLMTRCNGLIKLSMATFRHFVGAQPLRYFQRMRHRLDAFGVDSIHLLHETDNRTEVPEQRIAVGLIHRKTCKLGYLVQGRFING